MPDQSNTLEAPTLGAEASEGTVGVPETPPPAADEEGGFDSFVFVLLLVVVVLISVQNIWLRRRSERENAGEDADSS